MRTNIRLLTIMIALAAGCVCKNVTVTAKPVSKYNNISITIRMLNGGRIEKNVVCSGTMKSDQPTEDRFANTITDYQSKCAADRTQCRLVLNEIGTNSKVLSEEDRADYLSTIKPHTMNDLSVWIWYVDDRGIGWAFVHKNNRSIHLVITDESGKTKYYDVTGEAEILKLLSVIDVNPYRAIEECIP